MTEPGDRNPNEMQPADDYESPSIETLGSVAELTQVVSSSAEP